MPVLHQLGEQNHSLETKFVIKNNCSSWWQQSLKNKGQAACCAYSRHLVLGGAWDTKPGHNQGQGKATVPLLSPHRPCDKNQFLSTCGAWDTSRRDRSPRDPLCQGHPLSTRLHAALRTPLHARLHARLRARLLHAQVDFCLQHGLSQPKKSKAKQSRTQVRPRCVSHLFTSRSHGPARSITFPTLTAPSQVAESFHPLPPCFFIH